MTDISASLCVLLVLDRMDEERLSLLQEDVAGGKGRDCLVVGVQLLQAARQTSSLAARYLATVQKLGGDNAHLRCTTASQRSAVAEPDNSREAADFQDGIPPV